MSSKTCYVGLNATAEELHGLIVKFFENKIQEYKIDQTLSNRFKWLTENDSDLQQNLQNHFLKLERGLMRGASIDRIKSVVDQFTESPETTIELKQTFKIAKHRIQFVFHKQADGITETQPPSDTSAHCIPSMDRYAYEKPTNKEKYRDEVLDWVFPVIFIFLIVFVIPITCSSY